MARISFEQFVDKVNEEILFATSGEVDWQDLPDLVDLYEQWDNGYTAKDTAMMCLAENGWDE